MTVAQWSKIETLHRDSLLRHKCPWSDPDNVFPSGVFSSTRLSVCRRRHCMGEVWLRANGLQRANGAERPSSNTCSASLLEIKKGLCLKWLQKLASFQRSRWVSCRSQPSHRRRSNSATASPHVLMLLLFEEASIEQLWMTGPSFGLQAEEQVPEVDSGDALSHKLSAAGSTGASRLGGPRPWALEGDTVQSEKIKSFTDRYI